MQLFEAIVQANHQALGGDARAGIHPDEYPDSLPVVALTCIDPRLNPLLPEALGLPEAQFIWLRNAGNIITGPMSSTMRSIALACAIKGGREIVVIGHTDCAVRKTSSASLIDHFQALGIHRRSLPDDLREFFGLFASESQNVRGAVDVLRQSPLLGPHIPLHGLMLDVDTGKLEWVVNGYDYTHAGTSELTESPPNALAANLGAGSFADFKLGEMSFPDFQIGDDMSAHSAAPAVPSNKTSAMPAAASRCDDEPPNPIPIPPPIPPVIKIRQPWKKRR